MDSFLLKKPTSRFEQLLGEAVLDYNISLTEVTLLEESLNIPDNFIVLNEAGFKAIKVKYDKLKKEIEVNKDKVVKKKDLAKLMVWWSIAIVIAANFLPMGVALLTIIGLAIIAVLGELDPEKDAKTANSHVDVMSAHLNELSKLKHKTNNPKLKKDLDKLEDDIAKAITAYKKRK